MGSQGSKGNKDEVKDPREHLILAGRVSETDQIEASWRECSKYPGHSNFIPVGEFGRHHLPFELQRDDVLDFVKLTAALTVRLRVDKVSTERFPGCDGKLLEGNRSSSQSSMSPPASADTENEATCLGTGFILRAGQKFERCPCDSCKNGPRRRKSCFFEIVTLRCVVSDEAEAKSTAAELNFDDVASRTDGRMQTLQGVGLRGKYDKVEVTCVTHDMELGFQLARKLERWFEAAERFEEERVSSQACFIASHPHGQPKHVTVGERRGDKQPMWKPDALGYRFSYTTATCPGCSGARALRVGEKWGCCVTHYGQSDKPDCNDGFD